MALLTPITGPIQLKNFDIQCGSWRDADDDFDSGKFAGSNCGYVANHILRFLYAT